MALYFFYLSSFFFFFNDTATTEIYTLSLHDALPISSKKFKIAEGQWYRYAPSYVSPAYHLLEGFPFIQEGDKQEKHTDRKSGSAGMPRPISYAVFCLKKKNKKKPVSNETDHSSVINRVQLSR